MKTKFIAAIITGVIIFTGTGYLYDHYAGEIDTDKWYPQQAVKLFESWSKDKKNENTLN